MCAHAHTCETGEEGYQPSVPEIQPLIWISEPTLLLLVLELREGGKGSCHAALFDPIGIHRRGCTSSTGGNGWLSV